MPTISVVIPVFNVGRTLHLTLRCLAAQTLARSQFECVFVDDGSTDGTPDVIAAWDTSVRFRLLRNARNCGRSMSRNRGIGAADGEWVVFLDGDMLVPPDWLASYQRRFTSGNVEVVSGRRSSLLLEPGEIAAPEDEFDGSAAAFEQVRARACSGHSSPSTGPSRVMGQLEHEIQQVCDTYPQAITRALALITSNVAVSRAALRGTHLFCRWLRRGEDTELGLQLALRGARFAYLDEAPAVHPTTKGRVVDEAPEMWPLLFIRHPRTVVLLWYLWAARMTVPGAAEMPDGVDWSSLTAIAHAESTGALLGVDCRRLLELTPFAERILDFAVPASDLGRHMRRTFGISPAASRELLEAAIAEGMMVGRVRAEATFDRPSIFNWLLARGVGHDVATGADRRRSEEGRHLVRWSGTYELTVPETALPFGAGELFVNVPLPGTTRCQTDVVLTGSHPPDLLRYRQDDLVFAYPIQRHAAVAGEWTVRYSFCCTVRAWSRDLPAGPGDEAPDANALRRTFPRQQSDVLLRLLAETGAAARGSNAEKAEAITHWVRENIAHRPNSLSVHAAAGSGFGDSAQRARLFVSLCRLAGVPARERGGAVVSGEAATIDDCESPFQYTWAEFWNAPDGWVPVDWSGRQPSLGRLDPTRIHGGTAMRDLPVLAARSRDRWQSLADSSLRIRHRLVLA